MTTDFSVFAHLNAEFHLDHLAAVAGLSKFHFNRLFKQATGVSLEKHQLNARMNEARRRDRAGSGLLEHQPFCPGPPPRIWHGSQRVSPSALNLLAHALREREDTRLQRPDRRAPADRDNAAGEGIRRLPEDEVWRREVSNGPDHERGRPSAVTPSVGIRRKRERSIQPTRDTRMRLGDESSCPGGNFALKTKIAC